MSGYKKWIEDEVNYLKENWNVKSTQEIADNIGRTYNAIYMKGIALELGKNKMDSNRQWTEEEEAYLEENWGLISVKTLAKNLNRTENAIIIRVRLLELGPFLQNGEYLTINQLMNEVVGTYVGKGYTIKQWINKGFPVKTKRVHNNSFNVVYLDDFWDWAEQNSTLIDFSKLEPLALGKEPRWLEEQRRADIENRYFKRTPWTASEDKHLENLVSMQRYGYKEISQRLRRTEGAIKRRMIDLNIKARPVKKSNHNPWTKEEEKVLIDLYHEGHSANTMPNYIDRSAQSCRGKVERLIAEGVLFPRSEFRKTC